MKIRWWLPAVLAALLSFVPVAALAAAPSSATYRALARRAPASSQAQYTPGRVIVGLRPGSALAAKGLARDARSFKARWGSVIKASELAGPDTYVLELGAQSDVPALAERLARDPDVAYAEPDYIYHATIRPNDYFYDRLYAFPRIQAEQAWDISTGNPNILIAVVDTGIYAGHPDLAQNVVVGTDFVNGDNDAADDEGHGTHTAGIVAAVGNNGRGVAGVCWQCKVLSVKVLDRRGSGSSVAVASGIRYAVDRGARIINLSLGGENDSRLLRDAVSYAANRGALVVVAAGNEAREGNPVEYPAAYEEALAVGATDVNDGHAFFSNYGSYLDIAAPGVDIGSTLWDAEDPEPYGSASGTSEAAPFVAGLAGLIWSVNPALTSQDVRRVLLSSVDDLGQPGRDDFFGAGRINAYKALQATVPPPPPVVPPDGVLFPETGKILKGEFRRYWEANGGLPVFGFPVTDEQMEQTAEGSFLTQYFERNRLELHPENRPPYNVLLGRLGDTLLRRAGVDWQTLPKGSPTDGCRFFAETGHGICEPFLSYWRNHGLDLGDPGFSERESLALFGLPLTEPRMETNSSGDTVMTQWFERARFENHGPKGVLLGLLGREIRTAPTAPTLPPPGPPAGSCPPIPPLQNARVQPGQCMALGTEMVMSIFGFAPGEEIAYWLTAPSGEVFGTTQTIPAEPDGGLSGLGFPTRVLSPGMWYWVFQGKQTGRQAIIYFYLYSR